MNLSDEGALSSSVVCHGDFFDVKTTQPYLWQLICFPLPEPRVQDAMNEKQIASDG